VWLGVGAGHWAGLQGMSLAWLHSLHSLLSLALPPAPSSQTYTSHLLLICINTFPPKIGLLQKLETFSYMFFQRLLFFFLTEVDTVCSYPDWEDWVSSVKLWEMIQGTGFVESMRPSSQSATARVYNSVRDGNVGPAIVMEGQGAGNRSTLQSATPVGPRVHIRTLHGIGPSYPRFKPYL
jgi:hypothetical protein